MILKKPADVLKSFFSNWDNLIDCILNNSEETILSILELNNQGSYRSQEKKFHSFSIVFP